MRLIKSFKLFESVDDEYSMLMGKLLHLYGSIPVPKEKASIVIRKIIQASEGKPYDLGQTVDINYCKLHDKIRFVDYFDSLLSDKDARGHNFEGLVSGLYGGDLSIRGSKWDMTIGGKKISVKFVDHKNKAPEIGRFKSQIEGKPIESIVEENGGLTRIFKSDDSELKKYIWQTIVSKDIDAWVLAYPDNILSPEYIRVNYIDKDEMFRLLNIGCVVAPKGGYSDIYSLALSSRYINESRGAEGFISSTIRIPYVTIEELREELKDAESETWVSKVFGDMAYKIRPDVLRWMKDNKRTIIKRIKDLDERGKDSEELI